MGSCLSNDIERKTNELISSSSLPQITLYGASCSGKTTFLKQLDYLFNDGHNIPIITDNNIIHHIRQSCKMNIIKIAFCELTKYQKSIKLLNNLSIHNNEDLHQISNLIASIWSQQNIKKRYAFRYNYTIDGRSFDDNMDYFFDKIDSVMDPNYIPDTIDIIKYRTKNIARTNISKNKWFLMKDPAKCTDLTAMNNNEEEQTISAKTTFIIFMASLSDFTVYNIKTKQFAMQHSLDLFVDVIENNPNCDVVILFSKIDIFKQCLKKGISLRHCFGMEWEGNEYLSTNTSNLTYARILSKEMEMKIDKIIPNDLTVIIQQYLWIQNLDTNDEEYFELCCDEALEFIKQQYLKRCKNHKCRVWSQNVNLSDAEWTRNKIDIICKVQNIPCTVS